MRFTIRKPAEPTLIGLKALGPPPGKADLHTALEPMYRHGSHAAEKLALTSTNNDPKPANSSRPRSKISVSQARMI